LVLGHETRGSQALLLLISIEKFTHTVTLSLQGRGDTAPYRVPMRYPLIRGRQVAGEQRVTQEAELLDALGWRPKPPVPSSLELALLVWDFQKESPDYEYEVDLPEADFRPMYVEFVSAAYAAALDSIGDLKFPERFGKGSGLLSSMIGVLPGTKHGNETDELWSMAVAWEFDTWLERMLRINGGDVTAARELIENHCPIPDYVADSQDLTSDLLVDPDDSKAPDLRILLRWMGTRGWNDDRIREIVQEYSIMLNDWFKGSHFVSYE
jgi:hypothetical protein